MSFEVFLMDDEGFTCYDVRGSTPHMNHGDGYTADKSYWWWYGNGRGSGWGNGYGHTVGPGTYAHGEWWWHADDAAFGGRNHPRCR